MSARNRDVHRVGLIVGVIAVIGLALTVAGALAWHSSVQDHQKQAFQSASEEVSATAQTLLRRDTEFVATLNTVMSRQPNLSQSGFSQWYNELEGWQREVGSLGMTVVASVPADRLRSFLARRDAEPAFRALVGDEILPVRPDGQSHYCLISVAESLIGFLTGQAGRQAQEDWCGASSEVGKSQEPIQNLATATGGLVAFPAVVGSVHTMFFERAFYRGGAETSTPAQRHGAVMGWVVSSFDVATLLNSAIAGHKGLDVSLSHMNAGGTNELMGEEGAAGVHSGYSFRSVANVDGPWTVTIRGSVATSGLSAGTQELLVLGIGTIMTLLVAALALGLTRSRERALSMVEEKTGQLRHQALHDALTGLPNRVLALDRAEQMLARARRQNMSMAALYVDIDGFKHVNDSFGHAAGDELLRTVAARLKMVIRDADTAARLGGDEFIVLVESTTGAGPDVVAERLLEALRRPYEVSGRMGRRLSLTASIGVCSGVRENADELLRDADLALYQAKANGRNCYALFEPSMQAASQERLTLEMDLAEASRCSICRAKRSPAWRHCFAGRTRREARSRPTGSYRSPSRAA
jgi:diguanylate cyclase (GGDEF)-like protein